MNNSSSGDPWSIIESQLPGGWREQASEMGLVRRLAPHIGQKVLDIETALRLVLHYVAKRGSMRMTTASASAAGLVSISQPAFFKWMFKIGAYLEALVARMVEPGKYASQAWGGYVLIAADATVVSRPGATGTTARLHYALHLSDLRPRCIRVTDASVGETMRNFDVEPGELWIVDRGYSNPPSVLDVVRKRGDILVRFNRHTLSVFDSDGQRIDVPALLKKPTRRGRVRHMRVRVIAGDGGRTWAQLCWVRLPKSAANKARAHAMRDGVRDAAELALAEYMVVLTTAPSSRLSAEQALELYCARWQIELDFKRDKSIGGLDQLPSLIPETIHSWICAKVLLDLIARRLASQSVAIPPSGIGDAILPTVEAAPSTQRPRRRALVRNAARVGSRPQRAAATHAA
jgi:hypothetical protein